MDPAETAKLRKALSSQDATIGQHEVLLHQVMETLQQLSVNVDRLSSGLELVSTQLAVLTPAAPPPTPPESAAATHPTPQHQPREPHIPILARY